MWKTVAALGSSVALYLVAAKAHGRQLRLERQLAGHWRVVFGGDNPDFVNALWRRERVYFWGIAAALAAGGGLYALLAPRFGWAQPLAAPGARSTLGVILLAIVWPQIVAFTITGIASLARFAAAPDKPADAWIGAALWGSAFWWSLAVALTAAVGVAMTRRA